MMDWLEKLKKSHRETKLLVFMVFIYTAGVIVPAVYCYARLNVPREITKEETSYSG